MKFPTPADLHHPRQRSAAAKRGEDEGTTEGPSEAAPQEPDAAEVSQDTQPEATGDTGTDSPTGATAPNPGNLPRPTRTARTAGPVPVARDSHENEPPAEPAPRRLPNPASLMPRGPRMGRPGGLRARRLPKVEETSAGGVVLDLSATPPAVALIARHDRRSRLLWSLPKGHVEEGETPEQAALREVQEETGLVGQILAPLGIIDFWFVVEDRRIHKTVHHFVIEAIGGELSDEDLEVDAVEWFPFEQVARRLAYGDERRLVAKVAQIVPGVR